MLYLEFLFLLVALYLGSRFGGLGLVWYLVLVY